MHDVNWWLMALAFLLGLLLTLALMVRRVTREVPVTHEVSARLPEVKRPVAAAGAAAAAGTAATLHGAAEKVKSAEKAVVDKIDHVIEKEPYGAGSIRVSRRSAAPAGYTIKGDKDTGRYFTVDSPEYADIEAEVWFADEDSARKAGFLRWDAKGDQKVGLTTAAAAAVITEHHVEAETVIKEVHEGDASLVVVDSGSAAAETSARVVSGSGTSQAPYEAPYGKGSARASADGSGPAGWLIKGNADSMLYHGPQSPWYAETVAEFWFVDEATAKAAGFTRWDSTAG